MGAQISQVQPSQGNQPVNPPPTTANYSPAQQQMSGKGPAPGYVPPPPAPSSEPYNPGKPMSPARAFPRPVAFQEIPQSRQNRIQIMNTGSGDQTFLQELPMIDQQAQFQQEQEPVGKGGRRVMYSPLSNQPTMGQPNPYPNTIGQWDNASIKPQPRQGGKGKGY